MRTPFNKHKFIRVITFYEDKSTKINYYKREQFKPAYLIHSDHIFLGKGYSTIVHCNNQPETVNPLDFESKYDGKMFKAAINTKIIEDTFAGLKTNKFDLTQILLFLSLGISAVLLYFVLKLSEAI